MNNQDKVIKRLEGHIIGARYLLEVYKIAYSVNLKAITHNRDLAALLANTFLRSLILELCIIFNRSEKDSNTTNLSLKKTFNKTFTTISDKRPDLRQILTESISTIKNEKLDKLRNKKIAHLDMEEIVPSISRSDPKIYEKLIRNAENIIAEVIKENGLQPERNPPDQETDPALQQLKRLLI